MKIKQFLVMSLTVASFLIFCPQCALTLPPPPPPEEMVIEPPPYSDAVRVDGYWQWEKQRHRYVWVPGYWKVKRQGEWVKVR